MELAYIFTYIAGLLQGSLKEVEALQEVKAELEGKTTLLYTRLLEDLTTQVFNIWTICIAQAAGTVSAVNRMEKFKV